jgi:hypothetical protein
MGLEIVSLKNNILNDVRKPEVKNKIINRLVELNLNDIKYKFDNEFLLLVCNLIEHLVVKGDKLDKKELVLEIVSQLFNLDELDKATLSANIEFLHSNKQIKKVSYYKLFRTCLGEWFQKKSK